MNSIFHKIPNTAILIKTVDRVVSAIQVHIASENPLSCGCVAVIADPPLDLRVIVPAAHVIQLRLVILEVTAVAERVLLPVSSPDLQDIS